MPTVREGFGIGDDEVMDLSEFYSYPGNKAFICGIGCVFFGYRGDSMYDMHLALKPAGRGKIGKTFTLDVMKEMFTTYDARVIRGTTTRVSRAVRSFVNELGFTRIPNPAYVPIGDFVTYEKEASEWAV